MASYIKEIPNDVLIDLELHAYLYEITEYPKSRKDTIKAVKVSPESYEVVIDHIDEDDFIGFNIFIKSDKYDAIPDVDYIRVCDEFDNLVFSIDLGHKFKFVPAIGIDDIYTILDFNIYKCDVFMVTSYLPKRLKTMDVIRFRGRYFNYADGKDDDK